MLAGGRGIEGSFGGIAVNTWVLLLLLVVVLAVAAAALIRYVMRSRRRTSVLRRRFGGEYERTVERAASKREAESDLESRLERRARLDIGTIDDVDRQRYEEEWREVEALYGGSPVPAVAKADALVAEVLATLGYPMESFNERVA
jgi:biopolymer transport protein ExbB/TolQ